MITTDVEPLIEESVHIDAPPATVWALVSDLPRIAEWSPQVVKSKTSETPIKLGTTMRNLNRKGLLFWPTAAKVVRFEDGREVAFKIRENGTVWSFLLEPDAEGGGTTLTHRREAPDGISKLSDVLTRRVLGGQQGFQADLRAGMRQTIGGVKSVAESA